MNARENLCNVLRKMYEVRYFDNVKLFNDLTITYQKAVQAFVAEKERNCHTTSDFDKLYDRIQNGIECAANRASNHDRNFVYQVLFA